MPIIGYADLHCHPMAHLGFGGLRGKRAFFWGNPTEAIDQALPCCTGAHDVWHGGGLLPHFTEHERPGFDGFDQFESWPRHDTTIHQQMYVDCIKRAFRGGLKLIVASAVNTELLADLYHGRGTDSRDDLAITAQLNGMKAMAAAHGDWMQIVLTPQEARAAITAGKMAVVLAIEVDSIAGGKMRRPDQMDPAATKAIVDKWFDAGVRLVNPIHLVDNALGGTAVYDDRFNLSNFYLMRKWASDQPEPWFYQVEQASGDLADVQFLLSGNRENALLIQLFNQGYPAYIKKHGRLGHVNKRGLSPGGKAFVLNMMKRGMLIDTEHMSSRSLDGTIDIAEGLGYPLVSSHTGFRGLAVPRPKDSLYRRGCANESMRSDAQLKRMRAFGSVIGIGGHMGFIKDLEFDTSSSWAASYKYARDKLGFEVIAIGTDMNGLAQAPGPRFRRDKDTQALIPVNPNDKVRAIVYDTDHIPIMGDALAQVALGKKSFNYNTEGLAHYGLLPDFTLDVALSLGGQESMRAFFGSAEALIGMWEKCLLAAPAASLPVS